VPIRLLVFVWDMGTHGGQTYAPRKSCFLFLCYYEFINAAAVEISIPTIMIISVALAARFTAKTGVIPIIKNPIKKVISLELIITS
jgi:hypothetical protein